MVSFFRTLIMYILVIAVLRCMGKRQIGQLQPYELAIALLISDLATLPMQDTGIPLLAGVIPILSLLLAQFTISFLLLKSQKARNLFCGKARIMIQNGIIQETNLRSEMYTIDDLMEALRLKGYNNVSDINLAILENNGEMSIVPYSDTAPVTRKDMNIEVPESIVEDLIIDGALIEDGLKRMNVDTGKMLAEIRANGAGSVKDVLYCNVDENGNFTIQIKGYVKARKEKK